MEKQRASIMEVDVEAFRWNVNQIQQRVGNARILPVMKANAYGTYLNHCPEALALLEQVAVALVEEAVALRKEGYQKEIVVLNQPAIEEMEAIVEHQITVGVCEQQFIEALGKQGKNVKIHLELETGMGRTGIALTEIPERLQLIKAYPNIELEGVYTHLSSADIDEDYTKQQITKFEEAVCQIQKEMGPIPYLHCLASCGILKAHCSIDTMVRPGLLLYGFPPYEGAEKELSLKPVCRLKSKITYLKEVDAGTPLSYGQTYRTTRTSKIATVPIGYADGICRTLSNRGNLILHGKRVPIVGRVCMDSMMVDVTDVPEAKVGDDIYIWDNETKTLEEYAEECQTINYEALSTISDRVPRVFLS